MPMIASEFGRQLAKLARINTATIMGEARAARNAARAAGEAAFAAQPARNVHVPPMASGPRPTAPRPMMALPGPQPTFRQQALKALSPYLWGAGIGGLGGFYRGYTHDRKEPVIGGLAQGIIGGLGGAITGGLVHHAFK
jgi:hypothetical protein